MAGRTRGLVLSLLLATAACATFRDDLDRSRTHYTNSDYPRALALLEVLERDIDALSEAERAQYSYYRGMSYYRLDQKLDARHWLGVAAAREKAAPGALSTEEKKRVEEALGELNRAVWGGSAALDTAPTCNIDGDCPKGEFCEAGMCRPSAAPAEEEDAAAPAEDGAPGDAAAAPSDANAGQSAPPAGSQAKPASAPDAP